MNARFDLAGRTAFVSGAGAGIGRAVALAFGAAGAWVLLADRDEAAAQATLALLQATGGAGAAMACDVRQAQQVRAAVEAAVQQRGALDYAANVAGVEGATAPLLDESDALYDQVMDVNVRGVWHCMRAQLRQMVQQAQGGAIVNVSSGAGIVGSKRCAAYAASKHAVIGLTRSAALQYGPQGIRVNAICPAGVQTAMAERIVASFPGGPPSAGGAAYPLGRYSTAEEVANGILWLCSEGAASATGSVLVMDSGLTAS